MTLGDEYSWIDLEISDGYLKLCKFNDDKAPCLVTLKGDFILRLFLENGR